VRADAVHPIEHPVALAVETALDLQRRKLVRHDPHHPVPRVRAAAVLTVGEHFRRRQRLLTRAEWTLFAADDRRPLEPEVVRPLPPLRGDDDPPARYWVFTQFRQWLALDFRLWPLGSLTARESILKHFHGGLPAIEVNRDDVETARTILQMVLHHVFGSDRGDAVLLIPSNGFGRGAERAALAGLHFDEHQRRSIPGNDIDFATPTPEPPGKYCVPPPFELRAGQILACFP